MKCAGLLLVFLLGAGSAWAREYALDDAASPDGRYRVVAEEVDGRLGYRVQGRAGKAASPLAESDYSSSLKDAADWARRHVAGGEVSWRPDGRFAVVTETNHRHMGGVIFFARSGSGFLPFRISEPSLARATGLPWDRARAVFLEWRPHDTALLSFGGRLRTGKNEFETAACNVLVDLGRDGRPLSFRRQEISD